MMKKRSERMTDEQVKAKLISVTGKAFESKRDGCNVTLVRCDECSRMFEEELEAARAKVVSQEWFLCLSCGGAAEAPWFRRITVQGGWFLWS